MTWFERECELPGCGIKFSTRHSAKKYCSTYCRMIHNDMRNKINEQNKRNEARKVMIEMEMQKKKDQQTLKGQAEKMKKHAGLLVSTRRMDMV